MRNIQGHSKLRRIFFGALLFASTFAQAKVELSHLFADHMVIQRDTQAPVWGWADPGERIAVSTSWGERVVATTDAKGKWLLRITTPSASTAPQTISVVGDSQPDVTLTLEDVLVGDVWIASGQSNMEFRQHQSLQPNQEDRDYPLIRTINLNHVATDIPQERVPLRQTWIGCSERDAHHFSAAAFYFARRIFNETGVPIGLLSCSWGGMPIERFIPAAGFVSSPELKEIADEIAVLDPATPAGQAAYAKTMQAYAAWLPTAQAALAAGEYPNPAPEMPTMLGSWKTREATRIYNGMIHSLVPYAVKGAIWYQGEANMGHDIALYPAKKQALIETWRALFQSGEFPFYFVQLAGFQVSKGQPEGGDGFAPMREAQLDCLKIPNTGMAVAIDVGNPHDIHPKNKQDVGKRLAQIALHNDYGKDIVRSGPLYQSMQVQGSQIVLSFDNVGSGLMAATKLGLDAPTPQDTQQLEHFAIAGADQAWHWAQATIQSDTVVVSAPEVTQPVAVRFAYTATPEKFNFYNKDGLPASPFKTDDW